MPVVAVLLIQAITAVAFAMIGYRFGRDDQWDADTRRHAEGLGPMYWIPGKGGRRG